MAEDEQIQEKYQAIRPVLSRDGTSRTTSINSPLLIS
jgi:hypothetical protein